MSGDAVVGYVGAIIAIVFFGSNFLPVKKVDSGDGMFFQLMMCTGIWTVGLIVNMIRDTPKLYPLAMLGGVIWCLGNALCVRIIQRVGLGLGLLIWGFANLLMGWFTGFFGLYGLPKDDIAHTGLNIVGLMFALTSLGISFFINPNTSVDIDNVGRKSQVVVSYNRLKDDIEGAELADPLLGNSGANQVTRVQQTQAMVQAVIAGILFGNNFNPPTYIQTHNCLDGNACVEAFRGASEDPLDYVFGHFCGILLTSIVIFGLYSGFKKNQPSINPKVCVPAYFSGILWGCAQVGWFIANGKLGYTSAFPLVTIGPGLVGSLWSVFLFKEISGKRNFIALALVFLFVAVSDICTILSKN